MTVKLVHLYSFQVEILGVTDGSSPEYFHSVEGLKNSLQTERYTPGGANRPYYQPKASQANDLVLSRPLVEGKSKITFWCEETIDKQQFNLTQGHILILNQEGTILAQWIMEDIYPKGVAISPLCMQIQQRNSIVEAITIGYSRLVRTK